MPVVTRSPSKLTWQQKQQLARQALHAANDLRLRTGADLFDPVCPFQLCEHLAISLRFLPGNLEGAFIPGDPPRIIVSSDRPLARRRFTCAHEIGHHEFGHGASLDDLRKDAANFDDRGPEEFLADAFAGHLLMPVMGIRAAFRRRGVAPGTADLSVVWAVATEFGVGVNTLLTQLAFVMREITASSRELLQCTRAKFRLEILAGRSGGNLLLIDEFCAARELDVEVGHWILAPTGTVAIGAVSKDGVAGHRGVLFQARHKGDAALQLPFTRDPINISVARKNFVGLANYRFLQDDDEEKEE